MDFSVPTLETSDKQISANSSPSVNHKAGNFEMKEKPKEPKKSEQYRSKQSMWDTKDDERLKEAITMYGDDWSAVSKYVGNKRSRSQCELRWKRVLDPSISREPWTEAEEAELLQLVQVYGDKAWKTLAEHMPHRNDSQCRFHYYHMQKINENIIKEFKGDSPSSKHIPAPINGA